MIRKDKKLKYGDKVYYEDELNDDFEKNNLERKELPDNYVYLKKGFWAKVSEIFLYWMLCYPILRIVLFFIIFFSFLNFFTNF